MWYSFNGVLPSHSTDSIHMYGQILSLAGKADRVSCTFAECARNRPKCTVCTVYYVDFNYMLLCWQNVVMRLQNDWLGHWISLLVGHYTKPENEEKVALFVDQLLKQYVESGDTSM